MKTLKGFLLAFNMLSIIPFFKLHDFYKGINGYAVMFYPLVGFILGGILWLLSFVLDSHIPSQHLAIIIFALWVIITGALHLDGFSDTVDGLFVKKDRAFEVMADPHTGGMGMIFSLTFLILKASSLIYLDALYLLPVILMLSRFNATLSIYLFPYIGGGMATLAKEEFKLSQVISAFIYVIILSILFNATWLLGISILTLLALKLFFMKRYGGFSGDIYGFSIEVTELVLLNALLFGLA